MRMQHKPSASLLSIKITSTNRATYPTTSPVVIYIHMKNMKKVTEDAQTVPSRMRVNNL